MADASKSATNSKVINRVDQTTAMIPPGEEHTRCREALTNGGAGVNCPDEYGLTYLMFAASNGQTSLEFNGRSDYSTQVDHTQCVDELIKAGADVNAADSEGLTALMLAVDERYPKVVDLLIKAGADVNIKNKNGETALMYSVLSRSEACGKLLIGAGADVNIEYRTGDTPLLALTRSRSNERFVAALINTGADVNHSNKHGETALMYAAMHHENTVHLLLAAGADVNMKDQDNNQALHYACFDVPHCNNIEILLQVGADVNSKNAEGESPLFCAVDLSRYPHVHEEHDQYVEAVNILIKAGADVDNKTIEGRTALLSAAGDGFVKCVKALLDAGADVNRGRNTEGETALICASRGAYYHGFQTLQVAVHTHTSCADYKGLELLLEAGADVNATDNDGDNALFFRGNCDRIYYIIYINRCPKFIKRLLRAGILINRFTKSQDKNALGGFLDFKFKYQNELDDYIISKRFEYEVNYEAPIMLLYAAGETLDGTGEEKIPEVLKFEEEKFQLKHMCRMAIRGHMLGLDSHMNLFVRVPKLALPKALNRYLLFNMSLDE